MINLCAEVLIIYNGQFFSQKSEQKNVQINHFLKRATLLERQLLLTKLQIVGYFSFKLFI